MLVVYIDSSPLLLCMMFIIRLLLLPM